MKTTLGFFVSLVALLLISNPALAQDHVTFAKEVAPILQQHCQVCHHPGTVHDI